MNFSKNQNIAECKKPDEKYFMIPFTCSSRIGKLKLSDKNQISGYRGQGIEGIGLREPSNDYRSNFYLD